MLREVIVELKQENYALQKANERWRRLFNKPETALGDTSLLLD